MLSFLLFQVPMFPEQASTTAPKIDAVSFVLTALSVFFSVAVALALTYFAIKYRRGSRADRSHPIAGSLRLELAWSVIPLIMALAVFTWAASVYFDVVHPPEGSTEVYAVGRQWMWFIQHPTGQREINELHVPVGQPVKMIMTSQDVIHSFFVPAFRIKQDVVPGMFTQTWFQATKPGKYHLFCTEYCGTEHSMMRGTVTVLEADDYAQWLRTNTVQESMAQGGERLFREYGCSGCHAGNGSVRAPVLNGVYGKPVPLDTGETVIADDMYIHDSILQPQKQIVGGYDPIMPTYQGQIKEQDLMQIVYYIKSLR
jgi:cytochrome c oxidase subunit 2